MYDYSHVLFEKFQDKAKIVQTLLKCAPEAKTDEDKSDAMENNEKKRQSISTLTQKIKTGGETDEDSKIEDGEQRRNSSLKENLETIKESGRCNGK